MRVTAREVAAIVLGASAGACAPIINVQGSFFPAWLVCLLVGLLLTLAARALLARAELEPHLGPLTVVYPSLYVLCTLLTWLVFFRT